MVKTINLWSLVLLLTNCILHRNRVNIFPKCSFLNYFLYLCTQKRASLLTLGN